MLGGFWSIDSNSRVVHSYCMVRKTETMNLKLGHRRLSLDIEENIDFQLSSSRLTKESGCGKTWMQG